jgi:hypothetical protein
MEEMMTSKKEMAIILNKIAAVFGKEVDEKLVSVYHLALKHYPRMALADAAMLCVQENSFMPRPSELVEKIEKYDLERKWQVVEPSTERTYWVLFREEYESTDDISEAECREIFGEEYVGAPKLKRAGELKNISDEERLSQFRKLYKERNNVPQN